MKFELFKIELELTDDYEYINSISLEFNSKCYSVIGYYGFKKEIRHIENIGELLNNVNSIAKKYVNNMIEEGLSILKTKKIPILSIEEFKNLYLKKYFDFDEFSKEITQIPDSMASLNNLMCEKFEKCISGIFMGIFCLIAQNKGIYKCDIDKSITKFYDINNKQLDSNQKIKEIIDCIKLYPYNFEYYKYLIDMFYDENNEVEKLAKYLGFINIDEYKRDKVEKLIVMLKNKREDNNPLIINNESKLYGINDESTLKSISEAVQKIEDRIKTVDGVYYKSFELAEKARKEKNQIDEIMIKTDSNNLESLYSSKAKLERMEFELKDQYLNAINEAISKISKNENVLKEYGAKEFEVENQEYIKVKNAVILISKMSFVGVIIYLMYRLTIYFLGFFEKSLYKVAEETNFYSYIKNEPVVNFIFWILLFLIAGLVIVKVINKK